MDTSQPPPVGLDPLLSVEDLAAYLDVPRQTIYDWRVTGRGPRAYRVGKRLRFTVADVREWLDTLADPTFAPSVDQVTPAKR
jgi:excisionase family DNA binding protein